VVFATVFSTLCLLASDSFLGIGSFDTPNNIISQGNNTNVHVLKVITLAALIVFFSSLRQADVATLYLAIPE